MGSLAGHSQTRSEDERTAQLRRHTASPLRPPRRPLLLDCAASNAGLALVNPGGNVATVRCPAGCGAQAGGEVYGSRGIYAGAGGRGGAGPLQIPPQCS